MPSRSVDVAKVDELDLWIDNTQPLYRKKLDVTKRLVKLKKGGHYDRRKAPKAFLPVVDAAAKDYHQHFPEQSRWNYDFDRPTRRRVADAMVEEFEDLYEGGYLGQSGPIKGSAGWIAIGLLGAATFALTVYVRTRQKRLAPSV